MLIKVVHSTTLTSRLAPTDLFHLYILHNKSLTGGKNTARIACVSYLTGFTKNKN